MVVIHLKGRITEDGKLQINEPEQPFDLPPGEVDVTVKSRQTAPTDANTDVEWTEEELKEALSFHPVPLNQMQIGGWEDRNIDDSQAWVEEQRRKRREARRWSTG